MGGAIKDMDQQYFLVWWYGKLRKNTKSKNFQPKIHVLMRKVAVEGDNIKLEDHYRGLSMNSDTLRSMVLGSVWKFSKGGGTATPMYLTKPINAQTFQLNVNSQSWDYYAPNEILNGQPVIPEEIYSLYLDGEKNTFQNHFIYDNLVGFNLHQQGYSQRAIARELNISRNTVRKYINGRAIKPVYKPRAKGQTKLDPFKQYINERIAHANPIRLSGTVIFREIKEMRYTGGISMVRNYLRALRDDLKPQEVIRFKTDPGKQMQVDWGQMRGGKTPIHAFVCVLGFF